ncbi:succinyl-diaminopimelate desuccinylase [Sinosporangium album]|uniref:Succinyl-diaminopimelate desuccinylase n=1 Tax=Sinosporangium album TaxID=504805 RepID=A0A1G7W0N9_9ACTN|nr:succinyl-diaminopimelate desuccinylase [Sinosporangium album]
MDVDAFLTSVEKLLAIPSTAERPEELRRALDFVLGYIGSAFTVEHFTSNGRPSALVYAGAARPERFRVILNGHLDVVPAAPEQFAPRRESGRLYARGAQDMKVSALVMADVFRAVAGRLPYAVGLQLVTDEEVGGYDGTAHQLGLGVAGDFIVIGEQSDLCLVTESKGMAVVDLRAEGRSAHSAYQWFGDNAAVKLWRTLDRVIAAYPIAAEEVWRTTVNVSRVTTPNTARNQVPDRAEAWLDFRFTPEDGDFNGRTREELAAHLSKFCEPGVTPIVVQADPPHYADPSNPDVRALQEAARRQGYSGDFLRKHGAADGRFYYQRGMEAVIFGVTGAGQHGPDEYVDIASIASYHRALVEFLENL